MAERTIVNYGVYQFTEEERQAYRLRVYTQVIRHPNTEYRNLKFQKEQGFFGYAQLMHANHVHRTIQLQYDAECILEFTASDNLNTFLLSAHTYGVLQSIGNLASALGASVAINQLDPPLYPLPFDRVVFKLHSNSTLLVYTDFEPLPTLEITPALPWDDTSGEPEPLSSTEAVSNPLDEPYDIPTAPYDPLTADNGETYNPQRPEPANGTPGQLYEVYVQATQNGTSIGEWGGVTVMAPFSAPFVQRVGSSDIVYVRYIPTGALVQVFGGTPVINFTSWRTVPPL